MIQQVLDLESGSIITVDDSKTYWEYSIVEDGDKFSNRLHHRTNGKTVWMNWAELEKNGANFGLIITRSKAE